MLRKKWQEARGYWHYHFKERFEIIYVLSTMRSGSSLFKSLLQTNLGIPYHKEINLYNRGNRYLSYDTLQRCVHQGIVVAKKPSSFSDFEQYPLLHSFGKEKHLILLRHPNEIYHSVNKMRQEVNRPLESEVIIRYIRKTHENLLHFYTQNSASSKIVFYEDIVQQPEKCLKEILIFLGKEQHTIKTNYPQNLNQAGWGYDDPSEKFNAGRIIKDKKSLPILVPNDLLDYYAQIRKAYAPKD